MSQLDTLTAGPLTARFLDVGEGDVELPKPNNFIDSRQALCCIFQAGIYISTKSAQFLTSDHACKSIEYCLAPGWIGARSRISAFEIHTAISY